MKIEDKVTGMYNQIPYPEYGDYALTDDYLKLKEYIDFVIGFEGEYDNVYKGKKTLEGGCGTGRETMYLAYKGAKLTAIDITDKSLNTAKEQSLKYKFEHNINFKKASVLNLPFDDEEFEIVLSSGVIHHTEAPRQAFSELARVLKKDGTMILYVYNNYAHFFSNTRRAIVNLFAGEDVHKRVKVAKRLFPRYTKRQNLADTYDEFGHPHKSEHSIREVLKWFKDHDITYVSSYPKLGFRAGITSILDFRKYRNNQELGKDYYSKKSKPTIWSVFTSELFQLLKGWRAYSGGYRFVGKKNS